MNIVSLIMQYLGPIIVNKLATSLGINQGIAQKIVAAALPAILAAILGRVSQPGGAQAIADVAGKQDAGMLANLGNLIGGPQQAKIAEQGIGTLGGLLGGGNVGALTTAAAKFGGIGEAPTKVLLGMLAPAVLGTLGQQQKSAGLDAAGLGKMLMGQKDNIQAALPGDFAKLLGGTGLLDGLGAPAKTAAAAAPSAPAKASPAAPPAPAPRSTPVAVEPPRSMPAKAGEMGVWRWAALVAIALLGAWYFLGGGPTQRLVALPTPPKVMAGNADLGSALGATLDSLQTTLRGVKDKASAEAALPPLRAAQGEINRLSGLAGSLPGDSKKSLASYIAAALPLLLPMIENLLANSSYGPIVKPLLEQMVSKLEGMAKV